jgi:hypothetical protein
MICSARRAHSRQADPKMEGGGRVSNNHGNLGTSSAQRVGVAGAGDGSVGAAGVEGAEEEERVEMLHRP